MRSGGWRVRAGPTRRVWCAAALALVESVQDLLDVLPRELFDLCFLFVGERVEFVVLVARRLFLFFRDDVRELYIYKRTACQG